MGLESLLKKVQVTEVEKHAIKNEATDFFRLGAALDRCDSIMQVLQYLKVELEGRNRPSYVSRIYGRYRKMLPKEDQEVMIKWSQEHYDYARRKSSTGIHQGAQQDRRGVEEDNVPGEERLS